MFMHTESWHRIQTQHAIGCHNMILGRALLNCIESQDLTRKEIELVPLKRNACILNASKMSSSPTRLMHPIFEDYICNDHLLRNASINCKCKVLSKSWHMKARTVCHNITTWTKFATPKRAFMHLTSSPSTSLRSSTSKLAPSKRDPRKSMQSTLLCKSFSFFELFLANDSLDLRHCKDTL